MEYNKTQLSAIQAENNAILASAGAGTGKTSVMTGRICEQIIHKNKCIDQMLVVTFTNDAAFSMREKLRNKLRDIAESEEYNFDEKVSANRSLYQMSSAHISTIHSFCMTILRMGYMLVGIDPQFSVCDDAMRSAYFKQAITNAVENISKKTFPTDQKRLFGRFTKSCSAKDRYEDVCSNVYNTIMGIPDPYDRMHEVIMNITLPDNQNPWIKQVIEYTKLRLESIVAQVKTLEEFRNSMDCPAKLRPVIDLDIGLLTNLGNRMPGCVSPKDLEKEIKTVIDSSPDLRSCSLTKLFPAEKVIHEAYKNIHKEIKSANGVLKSCLDALANLTNTDHKRRNASIQKQLLGLEVLIREVGKCFTEIKNENNVLDFNDMEQLAYKILADKEHPDVKQSIQNMFTDIYVDECQDVSGIQFAIINALKAEKTNIFYVGDLKQSIYRFRHADPLLFLGLREKYQEDENANERLIYFQYNYRSSQAIVDCVNQVFDSCMDKSLTEIGYETGDHLIAGTTKASSAHTEIILINNDKSNPQPDETNDSHEDQCALVADKIKQLHDEGYAYKDIAILMRSTSSNATSVCDWLTRLHIPSYYEGKYSFYDVPEIAMFIEILKCIDNAHLDVPLLTTLKNYPLEFTDNELAEIRTGYEKTKNDAFYECFEACAASPNALPIEKKCRDAYNLINTWRLQAQSMKAADLIWLLLKNNGIGTIQAAMPGGDLRQKNLYALHQQAVMLESSNRYRLSDFLSYIQEITKVKTGGGDAPSPLGEKDDFVRIMTIHKSKGLEFPVVFILDMDRKIHYNARKNNIEIDIESNDGRDSLGLYMKCCSSRAGKNTTATFGEDAFTAKRRLGELAEETRVFYVGMTRAMERLILVGHGGYKDEEYWLKENKKSRIFSERSMLDMVMPAALNGHHLPDIEKELISPLWKIRFVRPVGANVSNQAAVTSIPIPRGTVSTTDFDKEWNHSENSTSLPAKTSVTSVLQGKFAMLEENESATNNNDDAQDQEVSSFLLPEEPEKPRFLQPLTEKTSANIGTIYHRFMRLIDLKRFTNLVACNDYLDALENELADMVNNNVFEEDEASTIRKGLKGIASFLMSRLGQIISSGNVKVTREKGFVVQLRIGKEALLVQGVIDVLYQKENGHWVIIDYKTDQDTRQEVMIQKHKGQLNCYRHAVEHVTNLPVDGMWIVSLRTGECYQAPKENNPLCS